MKWSILQFINGSSVLFLSAAGCPEDTRESRWHWQWNAAEKVSSSSGDTEIPQSWSSTKSFLCSEHSFALTQDTSIPALCVLKADVVFTSCFRQTSGEDFDVYLQNVRAQSEAFRSNSTFYYCSQFLVSQLIYVYNVIIFYLKCFKRWFSGFAVQ